MIIVEGPDGAGKTKLIERLNHHRVHLKSLRGGLGGTTEQGWAGSMDSVLGAYARKLVDGEMAERGDNACAHELGVPTGEQIAFDRFHLSERVYGPILRNQQLITDECLGLLGRILSSRHVPIILCLPSFKTTLANVSRDGRERPTYQTEAFLHMAYKAWELLAPYATIVFDYTKDPLPIVASHAD